MSLEIIILAAGKGKRMYSKLPKVLHPLAGKPMLRWVVEAALALNPVKIHAIVGHAREPIMQACADLPVHWVFQEQQLGTGHAVHQAIPKINPENQVLILSADVPLISVETLRRFIAQGENPSALKLLLAELANPFGLGRVIRNEQGQIQAIVEEKDATEQEKLIKEIYTGICLVSAQKLATWLPQLDSNNAQSEYYLTGIVPLALAEGISVQSAEASSCFEIAGVNNREQLQCLERHWQSEQASQLMLSGVTIADASRIDIRGRLQAAQDVFIDINTLFEGEVILGEGVQIGPNVVLKNVKIAANSQILANSVLEGCEIAESCQIGPFARIRPGTKLSAGCKIGNFVETKNLTLGAGSKANHLSYLGDAVVGKAVNIGAGTICCNYDGANKHQTIIEDGVFVGSGTELVAPVRLGANATIGAGSTIRKDAPAGELSLSAAKQLTIPGWTRPSKKQTMA